MGLQWVRLEMWSDVTSANKVKYSAEPRHLAPEDIRRELLGRRDSQEDLDAQRGNSPRLFFFTSDLCSLVLGTMQGDSLSKENLQGYMDLLRESGAFDQSM